MSFLLFFRGLIGVLLVFAVVTFFITHSISTTLIDTLICGVLIQLGYFAVVLFLVWRTPKGLSDNDGAASLAKNEQTQPLPNASRSRHFDQINRP
jgi:exopolysaccharide production repressor protein